MNVIDRVMCTKEFCPCDEANKDLYMSYSDEELRHHSRTKSLETMSQAEKEEYETLGADSEIIPLYFSDSGRTYSQAYECFQDSEEKLVQSETRGRSAG